MLLGLSICSIIMVIIRVSVKRLSDFEDLLFSVPVLAGRESDSIEFVKSDGVCDPSVPMSGHPSPPST